MNIATLDAHPGPGLVNAASAGAVITGPIAMVVHTPMFINVGVGAPLNIPLAGPGGHLSLLFTTTNIDSREPSLVSQVPGLAALADPWYGRRISQTLPGFAVVPIQAAQAAAIQKLKASSLSASSIITLGTPELTYYVDDPAVPQSALIPTYVFTGATALVDGQEVDVKNFTLPAVQGFLPDVNITSPPNGSKFVPGSALTLTGVISGTTGPFTYAWALDDGTTLATGTTPSGTVKLTDFAPPLPPRAGLPVSLTVHLVATNTYSANAEAILALQPTVSPFLYLPLIIKGLSAVTQANIGPAAPTANYRVGVEWIQNYNGTNPNLVGTKPDGDGFYYGLTGYGWSGGFRWWDNNAWEKDWRDVSLGGIDSYEVDSVDFAYFSGHGSATRIYFGTYKDATSFWGGNARYQYMRWAGFSSCQTLRHDTIGDWFNAFQGAHMLLGFESNMADVAFGPRLADNMRMPQFCFLGICFDEPWLQRSIREAWVQTAFEMNAGLPAYIYATSATVNPVDNKLPRGSDPLLPRPFPVTWYYWVWYY